MFNETVRVHSQDQDCLLLETQRQASCQGCSMKSGCGQYLLGGDRKLLRLPVSQQESSLQPGEQVQLSLQESSLLRLCFWFYCLPLLALLGISLLATLAGLGELNTAVLAFTGLGLSLALVRRQLRKPAVQARLAPQLQRLDPEQPEESTA